MARQDDTGSIGAHQALCWRVLDTDGNAVLMTPIDAHHRQDVR